MLRAYMHRPRFVRRSRVLAALLSSAACAACGSPPPPAQPVAPPPVAAVAAPPPPDLSPVPEPDGLITFARAAKPSEALKVIGGWVQFPVPGPAEVSALVTGESFANLVDLDQPIDFAMVLRGQQTRGAMSVAVRSLDEAKLAFSKYKLVPIENGALRIDGLGKADDEDKDGDEGEARVCELAPAVPSGDRSGHAISAGHPVLRLICAESEPTLHDLVPWLTRGAPRVTFPADVHLEVRLAPVRPLVDPMRRVLPLLAGSMLGFQRTGMPEVDDAFRAAVDDVADLASDAETFAFDGMIGEPQGTLTFTSRFRSTTSLLARLAVAHPERAAPPPAAFWKIPGDADFAYFHSGVDAADFEHPRDHVADVLSAVLAKGGLGDADRKSVRDAISHTLDLVSLRSEYAGGFDMAAAEKAIAALHAAKPADMKAYEDAERAAAEQMAGWLVVGVDAPASKVGALEKEWVAAWSRPGVTKWMHSKDADARPATVRMAPVPKGVTGKDAAHLELSMSVDYPAMGDAGAKGEKNKKKHPPGKPVLLHALVVPDGDSSWLVFAASEAIAAAKAKELVAGGASSLASKPGLASMKDAHMNAGGFVSARAFAGTGVFAWAFSPDLGSLAHDPLRGLASSEGAAVPVPFQLTTEAPSSGTPAGTLVGTATVPRAAIATIARMSMH